MKIELYSFFEKTYLPSPDLVENSDLNNWTKDAVFYKGPKFCTKFHPVNHFSKDALAAILKRGNFVSLRVLQLLPLKPNLKFLEFKN